MYCPACGREIPYGTATCGFCGTALAPVSAPPPPPPEYRPPVEPALSLPPTGSPPPHSAPGRLWLFFSLGVISAAVLAAVIVLVAKVAGEDASPTAAPTTTDAPSTTIETTTTAPTTTATTAGTTTTSTTSIPAGMTWSRSPAGEDVFGVFASRAGIAAGGPGVMAVGWDWSEGDSDGAVWTSVDGIAWARVPHDEAVFGGPGDQILNGVAAGPLGLVAVGGDWSEGDPDGAVWSSVDGVAWARVPHDEAVFGGPGDQIVLAVTAGGPGWVAVGFDGVPDSRSAAVWTSNDGFAWSRVPHDEAVFGGPGDQIVIAVAAAGPGLVAVGVEEQPTFTSAAVWVSADGLAWERVPHEAAAFGGGSVSAWMSAVATGGPGLVAVGGVTPSGEEASAAVWTSPDGFTWSRLPHDEAVFGGPGYQGMLAVTAGASALVAVGADEPEGDLRAAVWFSFDGLTWSRVAHEEAVFGGLDGEGMLGVAPGGPGFVAVGNRSVWVGTFPG